MLILINLKQVNKDKQVVQLIERRVTMVLAIFGTGILVGVVLIVALLRATMTTDPTGCVIIMGIIFTLLATFLAALPWMLFG